MNQANTEKTAIRRPAALLPKSAAADCLLAGSGGIERPHPRMDRSGKLRLAKELECNFNLTLSLRAGSVPTLAECLLY
jgi:hypothetical protein